MHKGTGWKQAVWSCNRWGQHDDRQNKWTCCKDQERTPDRFVSSLHMSPPRPGLYRFIQILQMCSRYIRHITIPLEILCKTLQRGLQHWLKSRWKWQNALNNYLKNRELPLSTRSKKHVQLDGCRSTKQFMDAMMTFHQ